MYKKLAFSTILQIKKKTIFLAYFSNLKGSALFQPQGKKQKFEYVRRTKFFPSFITFFRFFNWNHKIPGFFQVSRCTVIFKVLQGEWENLYISFPLNFFN